MRRTWPVYLVVAAALGELASLFLPWQAPNGPGSFHGLGREPGAVDAWSLFLGAGEPAAIAAVLVCALALVALARPQLLSRLPLGLSALCASYLMLAVAVGARLQTHSGQPFTSSGFHSGAGTYLGLSAAALSLLGVAVIRQPDPRRYWSLSRLLVVALAGAFLVVLLLPWTEIGSIGVTLGAAPAPGSVAAVLTLAVIARLPGFGDTERVVLSAAVLLFAAAVLAAGPVSTAPTREGWLGLGLGALLAVSALVTDRRSVRLPQRLSLELGLAAVAALLVGSFFLPWWTFTGGSVSGDILTVNAWPSPAATGSAALLLMLVVATVAPRRLPLPAGLLSAAVVLLVVSDALELLDLVGPRDGRLGSGAVIGLVATTLIAGFALLRLRDRQFDWRGHLSLAWPIAACLILLFFLFVPSWHVLPFSIVGVLGYALVSWLTVVEGLGILALIAVWTSQLEVAQRQAWLVVLPLGVLGLAVVDLFRNGYDGTRWDHGAVIGLSALLAALGVVEARVGIERIPFPEALRIDRL